MREFSIGLAGLGTVGGGVVNHLHRNGDILASRTGFRFRITRAAVRDPAKARASGLDPALLTTDPLALARDPNIQILVEVMGGTTLAGEVIRAALESGKAVVTANKALLAEKAAPLIDLARERKLPLCFEASVAGGIPILKALREGLVANHISAIHGIVNGTCNFILSSMAGTGATFEDALAEAQRLGYAEAEPSLDVDGLDAMHKAVILAALAYGFWADPAKVCVEGIRHVHPDDIRYARLLGYAIKLLAIVRAGSGDGVEIRVHPTLIPTGHVLASVGGAFNALALHGDVVGDTLFYGRGAGADPTASAVISDLAEAAFGLTHGVPLPACATHAHYARLKPVADILTPYYTRFSVVDRPGVLAAIAGVYAKHQIGISSVFQPKGVTGEQVPLILMSHDARESAFRAALAEIGKLDVARGPAVALRVEDFGS